jgi:hypothetical protein
MLSIVSLLMLWLLEAFSVTPLSVLPERLCVAGIRVSGLKGDLR